VCFLASDLVRFLLNTPCISPSMYATAPMLLWYNVLLLPPFAKETSIQQMVACNICVKANRTIPWVGQLRTRYDLYYIQAIQGFDKLAAKLHKYVSVLPSATKKKCLHSRVTAPLSLSLCQKTLLLRSLYTGCRTTEFGICQVHLVAS